MKIAVFGREIVIQKIVDCLSGNGNVIRLPDEADKAAVLHKLDEFNLVIVDGLAEDAEAICHCMNEFRNIPLVLIVRENGTDWRRLTSIDASGYLPEETGRAELAARIKSVIRRLKHTGQAEQINFTFVLEQSKIASKI